MSRERCLLGPRFMMLPSAYWRGTAAAIQIPPTRLLVTLGGGDPHNLWPPLLAALDRVPREMATTIVVGPFVRDSAALDAALERFTTRGRICRAPGSLGELVADTDLALTGAGQTLYELAALGRPAVAVQLADNQAPQLRAFVAAGAVVCAGGASDPGIAPAAVSMILDLARRPDRLSHMAAAGPGLVDGQGARRVAAAVATWVSRIGRAPALGE
jgi:spore coat polysaccharide biosynthesis predicted glycosyltransferase SpsG